ncbi:lytic murein transglycosylase [Lutimaribacter sp. EGI FJ00015]|uniref:Lytic murein transglycosylase n=1 Tax=Lutimaribacter degradans TaxID=2945989 RepID=A0ACC5ZY28_9RHOB|nr:lytic murein transglycosylase [Lutimaribacter sp. EGI FJ00013]MCM2563010.1 lytic murein transglycosylase [Lutimaribacter sp. EGI FJ00013]MCO0614178.1 lytic murein transglycosylase [Lutimaribacter sp. EGI FJ00015]MCO0636155.1 lytic murein transglycosylase [Lutimaribacter sp. EGI FJ00014]
MPLTRRAFTLGLTSALTLPNAALAQGFDAWLRRFRAQAAQAGISQSTMDAAFAGVQRLPRVVANDREQAEVTRSLQDYVSTAASSARIRGGQRALTRFGQVLGQIERRYGVEKEVIVAIWGMESSFGGFRGSTPVISTLATLAHEGRRADLFRAELLAALRIIQSSNVSPAGMQGSFAGAMGHTQFMPSTYLAHAVDFNGDGRRDIWGDDPTDALASTAALLATNGWRRGQPWAIEVNLPQGFDLALTGRVYPRPTLDWRGLGVTAAGGGRLPDHGNGALILPAGPRGPVFLIHDNFHVLKTYNYADSYVIGVGHLSDRLAGGGPIRAGYPRDPWGMSDAERVALQKRLNAGGFGAGNPDGVIGEKGRAAIRAYEAANGLRVTGVPSRALLQGLR